MAKTLLQAAVDTANAICQAIATTIVMQYESWLCSSGFPREVQNTIEDLPFDKTDSFNENTDESLHSLKDSRTTFHFLGHYTLGPKEEISQTGVQMKASPTAFLPPTTIQTTVQASEVSKTEVCSLVHLNIYQPTSFTTQRLLLTGCTRVANHH